MTSPLARATHLAINEGINAALRANERIGLLIDEARSAETADAFAAAVGEATGLLAQTEAGQMLGFSGCLEIIRGYATMEFPVGEDGVPRAVEATVRVAGIPGVEGRPLWVLTDGADVEAMRDAIGPGQVWVRSDLVKTDDWPKVRALAADAARRMLGLVRRPGRRHGSVNAARASLLAQIRATPDISDETIDELGVGLEFWDRSDGDYALVRQRVARARKDASSIKS